MRCVSLFAAVVFICGVISAPADTFRLEGQAFHPSAPVTWKAAVKGLPDNFAVYKVVPKQFSKETIARILEIADFKTTSMKLTPDQKTMQWRARDKNGTLIRSLDISPTTGWITYFNGSTEAPSSQDAEGVPSYDQVDSLALDYLRQLGGDTNQLSLRPCSRTNRGRSLYKKRGGDLIREDKTMRGAMYSRQLEGIRINGSGGRGGLWIEFGNHAKLARLDLNWRSLESDMRYRTATAKEMVSRIKNGEAIVPEEDLINLNAVTKTKKLTVTKVTPYYWGGVGGADQKWVYPFAELEVNADSPEGGYVTFTLFCPILSDKLVETK